MAWSDACSLSGYSCEGLKHPFVVRVDNIEGYGSFTQGAEYILLSTRITGQEAYAVTVHEFVHYLQYKRGTWTYVPGEWLSNLTSRCRAEKEAFSVSNKILARSNIAPVDWERIRVIAYGCPF